MKKRKISFVLGCLLSATAAFSQASWTEGTNGFTLSPISANVGIGTEPQASKKLSVNNNTAYNGILYGLYSYVVNSYSGNGSAYGIYSHSMAGLESTGTNYGMYSYAYSPNHFSTANTYGMFSSAAKTNQLGTVYGIYSSTSGGENNYGMYLSATKSGTNGTVYGIYSYVSGGAKRYAGYFTGGDVYASGKVGIGTLNPEYKLDVNGVARATGLYASEKVGIGTLNPEYKLDVNGVARTTVLYASEKVGIGTTSPAVELDVVGTIRAEEVKVCLNQGCDFVFDKGYNLMPLNDLSTFISKNKHLPEIAPAAEMESEGINLSEMNAKLLQKVEELTLYLIQQNEKIEDLETKVLSLENK